MRSLAPARQRWRRMGRCLFLAIALLGAASGRAAADIIVGTVIALRGEVYREAGGARQLLVPHQPLHIADTIVCGAGKAKIVLNDGSIISIGENSRLALQDYQSVSNGLKTRLGLLQGVLRLFVNRSTAGGQFEIETETAVAAVRGTDWVVDAAADKTGVMVLQGAVAVSGRGAAASAIVLLDEPRHGVDVARDAPPDPVKRWSDERIAATVARASLE